MDNINSNRVLLPILPIVRWYTYDDYFWNDFIDPLIFIRILILYTISFNFMLCHYILISILSFFIWKRIQRCLYQD